MNPNALVRELRDRIATRDVVIIVGAGVSLASTNGAPVAGWRGLIEHGIGRCEEVIARLPKGWGDRVRAELQSGDDDDLLSAAEKISAKLGAPDGGEFARWLSDTIGDLRVQDPALIEALATLDCPLVTTNYDDLIENVTSLDRVTWSETAAVEQALRWEKHKAVVHLHGHWRDPESVILGIRSYERLLGQEHAQALLRALRATQTLLFVGFGGGLGDPNFRALLEWARPAFRSSPFRHFRLAKEQEREAVQAQHPEDDRVFVLSYGLEFGDLAPFLRTLKPPPQTVPVPNAEERGKVATLPPRPFCIGRVALVEELVATLLNHAPPPTPILGGPGYGKTTVALEALHDRRVAQRYGSRRHFVRLDAARTADAARLEVATLLGIPPGPHLSALIQQELARAATLLLLDNAETPWDADLQGTEAFLLELTSVQGLALVVTLRGGEKPWGIGWREPLRVVPLELPHAREVFLGIAGARHKSDPQLDSLLSALDGLALAITLVAHVAETEPNLDAIWAGWQQQRMRLLENPQRRDRLSRADVSFELSIASPRMTDGAKRLLSLLGVLPDGLAHAHLEALLSDGRGAARTLRAVGLGHDDLIAKRLRTLAPIRDHIRSHHPPRPEDRRRAVAHYVDLAKSLGPRVGAEGGAEAVQELAAELGNVEAMLLEGLAAAEPEDKRAAIDGALGFGELVRFSGLGTDSVVTCARKAAQSMGDATGEANCIYSLGDIAVDRPDHEGAKALYEEALALYRSVGETLGEANCIYSLGFALERSDHERAKALHEEALALYRSVGIVAGEASCIQSLGDIALERLDHEGATARYEEALPLYRRVGDILGEANCIKSLGDIALEGLDHEGATAGYEEALSLYRRVGDTRGEANCIKGLGDVALGRSDHESATTRYGEALPLYRRMGSIVGEANCIQGLGDVAVKRSDNEGAKAKYENALALYVGIGAPHPVGTSHRSLARLAPEGSAERRGHVRSARDAWTGIKRDDLVRELLDEFREEC